MNKNERALAELDRITNAIKASMDRGWRNSWQRKSLQNIRRALLTAAIIDPLEPPTGWYMFGTHVDSDVPLEFYGDDEGTPLWERPIHALPADYDRGY